MIEPKLADEYFERRFADRLRVIRRLDALNKRIIKKLRETKNPIGVIPPTDEILYAGFMKAAEKELKYRL